jgi:cytoskeletal protein RodZ
VRGGIYRGTKHSYDESTFRAVVTPFTAAKQIQEVYSMDRKVRTLLRLLTLPLALMAAILLAGAAGYAFKANLVAQPATMAAAAQPASSSEPSPVTTSPTQPTQASAAPVPQTTPVDEAAEAAGQPDANEAAEPADANDNQPETDNQPEASDPGDGD